MPQTAKETKGVSNRHTPKPKMPTEKPKKTKSKTNAMINAELLKRAQSLLESYNNWNGDDYDATAALLDDMGTFMNDLISSETSVSNKTRTYYQPMLHSKHDSDKDNWWLPDELASFKAFATEEDAKQFVAEMGYSNYDIRIDEYHDDDIEGVTILDGYGNVIETNEEE